MISTWGIVGICYVAFWNIIGFATLAVSKGKDKNSKWIPLVIALTTIPPFLLGWFGNG